jgi:hypothetical protein
MGLRQRLEKLEARHPHRAHQTPVVWIPGAIDHEHWDAYLDALPCACGVVECSQRTIGLVLPEKMSVEAWEVKYTPRHCSPRQN